MYTPGGNLGPQFVAALKAMQNTLRSSITHLLSPTTSPWSVKHELRNLSAANRSVVAHQQFTAGLLLSPLSAAVFVASEAREIRELY